jgi:hypothetical protein
MSEQQDNRKSKAANIRLALLLGAIALGFYVAILISGLPGE